MCIMSVCSDFTKLSLLKGVQFFFENCCNQALSGSESCVSQSLPQLQLLPFTVKHLWCRRTRQVEIHSLLKEQYQANIYKQISLILFHPHAIARTDFQLLFSVCYSDEFCLNALLILVFASYLLCVRVVSEEPL